MMLLHECFHFSDRIYRSVGVYINSQGWLPNKDILMFWHAFSRLSILTTFEASMMTDIELSSF